MDDSSLTGQLMTACDSSSTCPYSHMAYLNTQIYKASYIYHTELSAMDKTPSSLPSPILYTAPGNHYLILYFYETIILDSTYALSLLMLWACAKVKAEVQ